MIDLCGIIRRARQRILLQNIYWDIAKSVKAQDFDSCTTLVRIQLSQPKKDTPRGCPFWAGIVPISPKLLRSKSVGSHSPPEDRRASSPGAGRANIRQRRKSNGTNFFMSDLDEGTMKTALRLAVMPKSRDFERFLRFFRL